MHYGSLGTALKNDSAMLVQVEEIPNKEELLIVDCQYFDVDSTASVVKTFDKEKEETSFGMYNNPNPGGRIWSQ